MKRLLSAVLAILMVASVLSGLTLTSFAFDTPNDVKDVALTLTAPKAGYTANMDNTSVTCGNSMEYKVIGVNWYKDGNFDPLNDRLGRDGNENYFIGGHTYTVKVLLEVKGNRTWNFKTEGGVRDYSYINATVNGQKATVSAHEISPENPKWICVSYTFETLATGDVLRPSVFIPKPMAGEKYPVAADIILGDDRTVKLESTEYAWYVSGGTGGEWEGWGKMDSDDEFIAGKDYRVKVMLVAKDGFRFPVESAHSVGEDKYLYGYVNGRQMSFKLTKYGDTYLDYRLTFIYDFVSCEAEEITDIEIGGISVPVAGQHPNYNIDISTGSGDFAAVTDDSASGGAQYGYFGGFRWGLGNESLTAESVFEEGKYYDLSFFIKSNDVHVFADYVEATWLDGNNIGLITVQTMLDDPTLAFVTVEFAPCGGGVMTDVSVSGVREPIVGETPDYSFVYGKGYGEAEIDTPIVWFDLTDNKPMLPTDTFKYGHEYELLAVLSSDKQIYGDSGDYEFAPLHSINVTVNGKKADSIAAYQNNPENLFVEYHVTFDCAKAPLSEVSVEVEAPYEGSKRAQQIALGGNEYKVKAFIINNSDTGVALGADDVYVGAKNYTFVCMLEAAEGYYFDSRTAAFVNGMDVNVISVTESKIVFVTLFFAEELPYYNVSFVDENGFSVTTGFITKAGTIDLPGYDATLPEGMKFAGWTLDGGMTVIGGEYYVTDHTEFVAVLVEESVHKHVYDNKFIDDGQGMHYRQCIDENCPDIMSSVIDQGQHQYVNMDPCEMECFICGHVRTTDTGFGWHNYEFACSEVCPTCGLERETTHTPGAVATCTEPQKCTVCSKVLAEALGHTVSGEATCTDAKACTVCGLVFDPAKGHEPGAEWMNDENGHWHVCAVCNGKADGAEHADTDGDGLCDVCKYDLSTGLGVGAIVAIVIAAVVVVGVGGFCVFWFVIKKKSFADLKAVFKKK